MRPRSGVRSGRIIARRILCSQLHRPSRGSRSDPWKGRGQQAAEGGLVTAHLPLQGAGRDAALAGGDQEDRQEPAGKAGFGLLEDRAGQDRVLLAAGPAFLDQPPVMAIGVVVPAAGEATRPAGAHQIGATLLVGAETLKEGRQIPRQVVQQPIGHLFLTARSLFVPSIASRITRQPHLSVVERSFIILNWLEFRLFSWHQRD